MPSFEFILQRPYQRLTLNMATHLNTPVSVNKWELLPGLQLPVLRPTIHGTCGLRTASGLLLAFRAYRQQFLRCAEVL